MKLVLIGAPASGKGTQARKLIEKYKLGYLSTGDMLREHVSKKTEIGIKAKSIMNAGKLVPDEIIIEIVKDRIANDDCKNGFILDGFPRNETQAQMLDDLVGSIDKAIYINVPDNVILERISGRLTCPKCGASFHKVNIPPKKEGICDECGSELIQRKDDTVETGKARLSTFHETAEPLIAYYRNKGLLFEINGLGGVDATSQAIFDELGE